MTFHSWLRTRLPDNYLEHLKSIGQEIRAGNFCCNFLKSLTVFRLGIKKNLMGQTLSEPITTKHTTSGEDERFAFGASCMQGWRICNSF